MMKETYQLPCNIAQSLNIVGDRWTLLIIHEILIGQTTFNQIKKSLEGISSNLLSDRLKYLEEMGLITAKLYSKHPPRNEYTLTESGRDLEDVFHALILWGKKHLKKCYKNIVHNTCQHEVQMLYYCAHCEQKVTVEDLNIVPVDQTNES